MNRYAYTFAWNAVKQTIGFIRIIISIRKETEEGAKVSEKSKQLKFYRMLLIINDMYNRSWSNLMIPGFKAIIMGANILTLYGTIRFSSKIDISVYIWCPMLLAFLSGVMLTIPPVFASIYHLSSTIIRKSKHDTCTFPASNLKS